MSYWPEGMRLKPIVQWPGDLTVDRRRSNFDSTLKDTKALLDRELTKLEATDVVLQIAVPLDKWRVDGFPRSDAKPTHPGLILTMTTPYGPLSYPCDTFPRWEDNLRALALALDALRMVERYGVTKRGEQYQGNLAIEARSGAQFVSKDAAWTVINKAAGYGENAVGHLGRVTEATIRRAKFRTHPDTITVDNDPGDYQKVVAAEQYLKEVGAIA